MRHAVRAILGFVILAAVLTRPVSAQIPTTDYRALVDDYRRYGASAVPRAIALDDAQIADGRRVLAGSWQELRAAAILHTEAMLRLANDDQLSKGARHLDAAVALLDEVVQAAPEQQDFAYRWFSVTESLLREVRASASANALRRKGKDRFSEAFLQTRAWFDDAVVFEVQGCREGAALSAQALGKGGGAQLPSRWFLPAARLYQNVLDKDPAFLTPALHLGRLSMLEGRLVPAEPRRHVRMAREYGFREALQPRRRRRCGMNRRDVQRRGAVQHMPGARAEQGLQVGAPAGNQHDEALPSPRGASTRHVRRP